MSKSFIVAVSLRYVPNAGQDDAYSLTESGRAEHKTSHYPKNSEAPQGRHAETANSSPPANAHSELIIQNPLVFTHARLA